MITDKEFSQKLQTIYERADMEISELIEKTKLDYGLASLDPLPWDCEHDSWEDWADNFIDLGGRIYDSINGRFKGDRRSMRRKLRKVLGYVHP